VSSSAESRTLGDLLRRYRQAAGLTQEELAGRSGLSVRAIGDLERDQRLAPRKDTISLLAQALSLTPVEHAAMLLAARRSRRVGIPEPARFPEASQAIFRPAPLALPLTPLIGREREEAAAIHLWTRGGVRLLTLIGPAGVGKTRLAMQVAATLQESHGDGAISVELAAIREAERVLPAIAQAVDVRESGDEPLRDALLTALRGREALLVLDTSSRYSPRPSSCSASSRSARS
jgi:transcriptional regulator with XRE-family HTH domain